MRESVADYILKVEGGFADNPKDPGGRTNFGITAATLASARARLKDAGLPEDVKDLTKEQALAIYEKFYWKPAGCDHIPRPVDLALFDGCVNCGVRQGVKFLQEALNMLGENLAVDGIFGQKTMQAAWEHALPKTKIYPPCFGDARNTTTTSPPEILTGGSSFTAGSTASPGLSCAAGCIYNEEIYLAAPRSWGSTIINH